MFALAVLALVPTVFATLQVAQPTVPIRSSSPVTITWTSDNGDPTFSIELINLSFNHAFAIANNVDPNEKSRTLNFPAVPAGEGYSIQFVNIANINDVYTTTGDFAIEDAISTTTSTASSTTSSTGAVVTPTISHTSAPSSGFGTTRAAVAGGNTSSAQASASASASSSRASNTAVTLGAPKVMGVVAGLLAWLAL